MKIAVIMLAAGNSRRFGSNKLMYSLEGVPMYKRGLLTLKTACETLQKEGIHISLTVVTQYEEIAGDAKETGAEVRINPHPEEGISSSLRIGLEGNTEADACLFSVADQPWLTAETVAELVRVYLLSGKGIACISHGESPGNPCVFSKKYYGELLALTGDIGGKRIIKKHPEDTELLAINDKKELEDIDFLVK